MTVCQQQTEVTKKIIFVECLQGQHQNIVNRTVLKPPSKTFIITSQIIFKFSSFILSFLPKVMQDDKWIHIKENNLFLCSRTDIVNVLSCVQVDLPKSALVWIRRYVMYTSVYVLIS